MPPNSAPTVPNAPTPSPAPPQSAPLGNLTPQLSSQQLKENIDALQKGGLSNDKVQAYVNNYKSDGKGGFVLASSQTPSSDPTGPDNKLFGSPAAPVVNAITSSEQNAGKDLSATISENLPSVKYAQSKAQESNQQLQGVFERVLQKRHDLATQGKDTSQLDEILQEDAKTLGVTNLQELLPQAAKKSTGEVLGDFGGVALDAATAGTLEKAATSWTLLDAAEKARLAEMGVTDVTKATTLAEKLGVVGKQTAKRAAEGAAVGYGYDVSQNLQSGKNGAEVLTPGAGTALGAALPVAFGAFKAGRITAAELAPRIDNSLIKPLPKQFRYGANPGRTMADLGITGNSFDELGANVKQSRNQIGTQIGQIGEQLQKKSGGATLDLTKTLSPIDEAVKTAAANNDTTVLQRLQNVKRAITEDLLPKIDAEGNVSVTSKGPRNLSTATFQDALDAKRRIGDLTKFTGNASDDKAVNSALKQVYGNINSATKTLAHSIDENLATKFDKANQQFADLQTAHVAIQHRSELIKGQNLVSLGQGVRGAGAVATAFLTGGPVAGVLAGISEIALEKALSSPGVKTRAAAWLAKQSPSLLENLYTKNPAIRSSLIKLVKQ